MEIWLIALLVFFVRMVQNAIGTVRDILVIRGERGRAALLSFAETTIWLAVFCLVLQGFFAQPLGWTTALNFLAFASGFAVGSYLGVWIEERMALGYVAIAIIPSEQEERIGKELKQAGLPLTIFPCQGERGPHYMYLSVVPRRHLSDSLKRIQQIAPRAFITVVDARMARSRMFGRQTPTF